MSDKSNGPTGLATLRISCLAWENVDPLETDASGELVWKEPVDRITTLIMGLPYLHSEYRTFYGVWRPVLICVRQRTRILAAEVNALDASNDYSVVVPPLETITVLVQNTYASTVEDMLQGLHSIYICIVSGNGKALG